MTANFAMTDLPAWPTKMTRDEQKLVKARRKAFNAALKASGRAAGWRFAAGTIFRREGDWFFHSLPTLLWQRGVIAGLNIKPMAMDPLFWDIVGIRGNESLPLSFRANGAWTVRPMARDEHLLRDVEDPDALARGVVEWATDQCFRSLQTLSIQQLLNDLPPPEELGFSAVWAICLHIMNEDFDQAVHLCERFAHDGGGFVTVISGEPITVVDQAHAWIVRKFRERRLGR